MTLMQALQREISSVIQARGREYFSHGAVRSVSWTEDAIHATVQGGRAYHIEIRFAGKDGIGFYCSCPYFDGNSDVCKHIWAAFLAAERDSLLPDWNNRKRPDLYPEDSDEELEAEKADDSYDDYDEEEEKGDIFDDEEEIDFGNPGQSTGASENKALRQQRAERMRIYWQKRRAKMLGRLQAKNTIARPPQPPNWKRHFENLLRESPDSESIAAWPPDKEIHYVLRISAADEGAGMAIGIEARKRGKNGAWGKARASAVEYRMLPALPDPQDRRILPLLLGTPRYAMSVDPGASFYPSKSALAELLPLICGTGRCYFRADSGPELQPIAWDDGEPWQFQVEVRREKSAYSFTGTLCRGEERAGLDKPVVLFRSGFLILDGKIGRLEHGQAFDWIRLLRREGRIEVPERDRNVLIEQLLRMPRLPAIELPADLRFEQVDVPWRPLLKLRRSPYDRRHGVLYAEPAFEYDGILVPADGSHAIADVPNRRRILRDGPAEKAAIQRLAGAGVRREYSPMGMVWTLAEAVLPHAVRAIVAAGWQVEAQGKLFRTAGAFKIEISSGIDWFELRGTVEFGDSSAALPALLAALKRKEDSVRLDDGSVGILPEEWLRKYGILAGLGTAEGDHLRFHRCQAGLLDALLAAEPEACCDEVFERARARLREFTGVSPAQAAPGFCGELREYQREGLGWIHFLREFGFGGCLADDMGLGKTIQVLALLESRRELRARRSGVKGPAPSLVVAPRSLIFNWKQEAARFTPRLSILDHTGMRRTKVRGGFDAYDLVLTTYGTLRRDAAFFKDLDFDYVILDEAQAIKNASTASAKAARLLKGSHRLALSGTPVENHLGELWSLFEFLNPGMLGSASVFKLGQGELRKPDPAVRELLTRALRPFILRRTKAQVAPDLPDKVEQTLFCELEGGQRRLYDELRDHYRRQLLRKVERDGIRKSSIQILEALLRLRQAAIHPGLVDPKRADEPSAKLEALLPQLDEVLEEGHKALVFSQFTSMLAILKPKLQAKKMSFAYLDGKTRDRQAEVERFQNDPSCPLFLISLKAGGLGLNLTAAEYVFLLDPWWNPAVEMQAVDRSHRIGQTRTVFAYRLIARDTVEEKVLELQRTKRDLASAIINADNSLIRDLRPEDLVLLLS
jgi:superfamily II DNA or RNA helicase